MSTRDQKLLILCTLALAVLACQSKNTTDENVSQVTDMPNIIYILADDLGYGDLGVYGSGKIETPNIDQLAANGMLFTQHYSGAPVCAPARYMLMTGQHAGRAYIRGNDEWRERSSEGDVWNFFDMERDSTLEGQRPLPEGTLLFPELLQKQGYVTGAIGKWGLGAPHTESIPTRKGFDFFFGYNCQRQAHTYYPGHLYKNEKRVYLRNEIVPPPVKLAETDDKYIEETYRPFNQVDYAPDLMFTEMTNFISENKSKPFFFYWASPIPHVALQAPKRWVDHYIQKFGEEEPYIGDKGYFPSKNPRATYAAMVSYLDENVGKLIAHLKKEDVYENTLIIFTSDNGPTYTGGADSEWFQSAGPFVNDHGRTKGFVYEGGIRVPMIASWPGKISAGAKSDLISSHIDMMATFGELTGYSVVDTDGVSLLPTLLDEGLQKQHEYLYWEFPEAGGQVAIRIGDWKVIRQHLKDNQQATLEVYNLKEDPLEQANVAADHPEIVAKAVSIFEEAHQTPEVEKFRIPVLEKGFLGEQK